MVKELDQLNLDEKTHLEQMIKGESSQFQDIVKRSSNNQELIQNLIDIVRSKPAVSSVAVNVAEPDSKESGEKLEACLKKMGAGQGPSAKATLKASLKQIQKIMKKFIEAPKLQKNRRILLDAFDIKKFITAVPGAQEFLEAAGFHAREENKKKMLEIDQNAVKSPLLESALNLIATKLNELEESEKEPPKAPAAARPRPLCNCGFWGDEKTENLCSKCYNKKYNPEAAAVVEAQEVPQLCKTPGCGFWGLKKFRGFCSVCYTKDSANRKKELKRTWRIAITKIRAVRRFRLALRPVQKNKTRCYKCKRRVGIDGIECRCGYIFCGKHRYADEHECEYDYKKAQRRKLMLENIQVAGKKFDKIDGEE
jgi:hypothetical protein